MDANEPVVVATTTNFPEAEILKNLLENEGLKCELEGENQGSLTGVLGISVMVRAWDADRARKILAAHEPRGRHAEA